jgi:hypothetical protein
VFIILLCFCISNKDRNYLANIHSYKLQLKAKDKELETVKRELHYYKNLKPYEEYLKD